MHEEKAIKKEGEEWKMSRINILTISVTIFPLWNISHRVLGKFSIILPLPWIFYAWTPTLSLCLCLTPLNLSRKFNLLSSLVMSWSQLEDWFICPGLEPWACPITHISVVVVIVVILPTSYEWVIVYCPVYFWCPKWPRTLVGRAELLMKTLPRCWPRKYHF